MAADVQTFKSRFPEFTGDIDPEIELVLDEAFLIHDIRELATLYCAAHLLALNSEQSGNPDGGSGVVGQETLRT